MGIKTLLISFLINFATAQLSLNCLTFFINEHMIFNQRSLSTEIDKIENIQITVDSVVLDGTLFFNFCNSLELPQICAKNFKNSHAYFLTNDKLICYNLYSSHSAQNQYKFLNSDSIATKTQGFQVVHKRPDFKFQFICDPNFSNPRMIYKNNRFEVSWKGNCGEVNMYADFLDKNRSILSILMLLIGLGFLLFGYFKKPFFRRIIHAVVGFYLTLTFYFLLISYPPHIVLHSAAIILCSIVGISLLFVRVKSDRITGFVTGFACGCVVSYNMELLFAPLSVTVG